MARAVPRTRGASRTPRKPEYTFHLADPTCDINDPNGPMYDPVHGIYHNFYQIHIAEDQNGAGDGMVTFRPDSRFPISGFRPDCRRSRRSSCILLSCARTRLDWGCPFPPERA